MKGSAMRVPALPLLTIMLFAPCFTSHVEASTQADKVRASGLAPRLDPGNPAALVLPKSLGRTVVSNTSDTRHRRHVAQLAPATEVRARHILVRTEAEARELVERLNRGGDFATLARSHSIGPSKRNGGDLGYFRKGMMVAPFEEAAFALDIGEVSEPIKTQFGWHVIKVEDRR